MTDDFKYKNFDHYPNMTGEIKPSKKGNLYSIKFDTAPDVSYSLYHFSKAFCNYFGLPPVKFRKMHEK